MDTTNDLQKNLISWRRHLHRHPELSFEEKNTSLFIQEWLRERDIPFTSGWAGHGIVASVIIDKDDPKFYAFRDDMDALPIQEENPREYCSQTPGIMHACGHDVHTTCLLGAIELILNNKDQLKSNLKFIFQPGEEKLPGGASIMLKEGAIDVNNCKGIFGLHVQPSMEVGTVGFHSGIYMASSDELYITVKGKGGHGAMPQDTIDPIYIASSIIIGLQEIISRKSHPASPSILTIGKINSVGGATNIIPSEVKLEGTFRAMDEAWRKRAHLLIRKTCEGIAESFGGSAEVDIVHGYPVLINDEHLVQSAKQIASQILGTENVINLDIRMTSEDFAWYTQQIPGCFFRLGTGNSSKGITSGVHTATFDVDEDCLMIGANTLSLIALSLSSEC